MLASRTISDLFIGALSACALAASFPNANLPWLAPVGIAGMVWTWRGRSAARAALVGYAEGLVFFAIVFSWFGETVGSYVGPFAPLVDLIPAAVEAPAFAVTAAVAAWAARSLRPALVPFVTALTFTLAEGGRASGLLGVPFGTLAEPLVTTALAPLAALGGGAVLTFAAVLVGAEIAASAAERRLRRSAVITFGILAAVIAGAHATWPARTIAVPTTRVVAVQGNIKQTVKWTPSAFPLAVERYVALTETARDDHAAIVVWPESVIPAYLDRFPGLLRRFTELAVSMRATIVVGADQQVGDRSYNALWYFDPSGGPPRIYQKRRLVPFAESFPGDALIRGPLVAVERLAGIAEPLVPSTFSSGAKGAVIAAGGFATAPLICWESGFAGLTQTQIRAGADLLIVSTDDAWFGETGGPYQHAQLAQLRAVETGRWVVRAAATGISGIIAPDGSFRNEASIDTQAVVRGAVGKPQPTVFSRIGPLPVTVAMLVTLLATGTVGRRKP